MDTEHKPLSAAEILEKIREALALADGVAEALLCIDGRDPEEGSIGWKIRNAQDVLVPMLLSMLQPHDHSGDDTEKVAGKMPSNGVSLIKRLRAHLGTNRCGLKVALDTLKRHAWDYDRALADLCQAFGCTDAELAEAGRAEIARGECVKWTSDAEIKSGPSGAAVREAVEYYAPHYMGGCTEADLHLGTLLRAAQSPRLAEDEFVRWCGNCACGKDEAACDSTATGHDDFDGVKCSGWSPRLTEEQVVALRKADMLLDSDCIRAAFPGVFGQEG